MRPALICVRDVTAAGDPIARPPTASPAAAEERGGQGSSGRQQETTRMENWKMDRFALFAMDRHEPLQRWAPANRRDGIADVDAQPFRRPLFCFAPASELLLFCAFFTVH